MKKKLITSIIGLLFFYNVIAGSKGLGAEYANVGYTSFEKLSLLKDFEDNEGRLSSCWQRVGGEIDYLDGLFAKNLSDAEVELAKRVLSGEEEAARKLNYKYDGLFIFNYKYKQLDIVAMGNWNGNGQRFKTSKLFSYRFKTNESRVDALMRFDEALCLAAIDSIKRDRKRASHDSDRQ